MLYLEELTLNMSIMQTKCIKYVDNADFLYHDGNTEYDYRSISDQLILTIMKVFEGRVKWQFNRTTWGKLITIIINIPD